MQSRLFTRLFALLVAIQLLSCSRSHTSDGPALNLTLTTLEDKDNSFLLTLVTKRLREAPEEEYLPNGLTCEFLIYNQANELVWQSSFEKKYIQVIGKVPPVEVETEYSCGEFFLGEGNLRKGKLPPGAYHIIARIPAKPEAYVATADIILK